MLPAMPRKVCSRVASACSGPAELRPGGAVSVRRLPGAAGAAMMS